MKKNLDVSSYQILCSKESGFPDDIHATLLLVISSYVYVRLVRWIKDK